MSGGRVQGFCGVAEVFACVRGPASGGRQIDLWEGRPRPDNPPKQTDPLTTSTHLPLWEGRPRPEYALRHIDNITRASSVIVPRRDSHKGSATLEWEVAPDLTCGRGASPRLRTPA